MSNSTKRFGDWVDVNCNECEHYWNNTCDGVCKGSQRACNSFLATRSVVIPAQIDKLRNDVKWLGIGLILETIMLVILGVIAVG